MASADPTNNTASNCVQCDQPDTERMVGCDLCDNWAHYECAGVSDSIENPDRTWKCHACRPKPVNENVRTRDPEVRSNCTRRSQIDYDLMMLKEQHELRMRALAEEEEARKKRFDAEEDYIRKKYEMLKEANEAGGGSVGRSSREKVSEWLASGTTGNNGQNVPARWEFPMQPASNVQPFLTTTPNAPNNTLADCNPHNMTTPSSSSTPHASLIVSSTIPTSTHVPVATLNQNQPLGNNPVVIPHAINLPPTIRWSSTEISPTTMLQMIRNERHDQFKNKVVSKPALRSTPRPLPPRLAAIRAESNILTAVCRGSIPSATTFGTNVTGAVPRSHCYIENAPTVSLTNSIPSYDKANVALSFPNVIPFKFKQ